MPRRVHLALALILLLVLAPLARATCGIGCLAAIPHPSTPVPTAQPHCVRATACCHSGGPVICAATQAPESIATLFSTGTNAQPEAPPIAVLTAKALSQNPRSPAAQNIDGAPPGQALASSPTPLRI